MSILSCLSVLVTYILVLLAMAFYTLMERKFLGYFQLRKGPNKPGVMGIPQPFADAIKLFLKEQMKPTASNLLPYTTAPFLSLSLALMMWTLYPHPFQPYFLQLGILFFLCVSSMNVYATFIGGWSSNSKYALLGAIRAVAQTISYEVSMSLILITALMFTVTFDLMSMLLNQMTPLSLLLLPICFLWFITNLAETSRTPFDLAEGESELVSGFNIEYSAGMFALIFMAEYTNILSMSLLSSVIFLSHLAPAFTMSSLLITKTVLLATLFIWIRATFPRMRYDRLMTLTWKSFLPLALSALTLIIMVSN